MEVTSEEISAVEIYPLIKFLMVKNKFCASKTINLKTSKQLSVYDLKFMGFGIIFQSVKLQIKYFEYG